MYDCFACMLVSYRNICAEYARLPHVLGKIILPMPLVLTQAVRDGPLRLRCKYLYTTASGEEKPSGGEALRFTAVMLIREHVKDARPGELEPLLDPTIGCSIYDPQALGDQYMEIRLPGRTTLFFPTALGQRERAVLTMQWEGKALRYQADRKFSSLSSGMITSLELTEIAPQDSGVNYFN